MAAHSESLRSKACRKSKHAFESYLSGIRLAAPRFSGSPTAVSAIDLAARFEREHQWVATSVGDTDFARISQSYLKAIALRLNQRPRKTLGFEKPADRLQALLH
jgi:hypothetical protein